MQKIGISKGETKGSKAELPIGFDSPPVTPKSVRPPLSPRTDYDLRTACALILQEYQPPIRTAEAQYEDEQDTALWLDHEWLEPPVEEKVDRREQSFDPSPEWTPERPTIGRDASEEIIIGMFEHESMRKSRQSHNPAQSREEENN